MRYVFKLCTLLSVFVVSSYVYAAWGCYETKQMCEDIEDLGEAPDEFPNPVFLDIQSSELDDTWGAARSQGRTHEGTDIIVPKGSYIVMPTDGVVDRTGVSGFGGKHAFVYIGGNEKMYFAHLDDWADGLSDGDKLRKGDLVGYVGNTGATHAPYHLHFTIYTDGVPSNAYHRMKDTEWRLREKMNILDDIIDDSDDPEDLAEDLYTTHTSLFAEAIDDDIRLPGEIRDIVDTKPQDKEEEAVKVEENTEDTIENLLDEIEKEQQNETKEDLSDTKKSNLKKAQRFEVFEEDLSVNRGSLKEIKRLQHFLNDVEDAGIQENGRFNNETLRAVKEFQTKYKEQVLDIWGLESPSGYVGITTRLKINFMIQSDNQACPVFTQYNSLTENTRSDEVERTEELLQELGFFNGTPNTRWDDRTHQAMIDFQNKFSATMLQPWGLSKGTGYKYKTTNKFMNYLVGCDTGAVELDGKGSFDF